MISTLVSWLLSFLTPTLFRKAGLVVGILLLSSTVAFGYIAKQQYDSGIEAQYSIANLENIIDIKNKAEAKASKLLIDKIRTERLLRHEIDKLKGILEGIPDDGCLDKYMPDAVLNVLR